MLALPVERVFLDKTFYGFNRITGWLYKMMI
nr:MAG TPA: hypothetical protein [Caudoviricetes sp.]